jgi:methionyl aminopeptidase
MSRKIHYKTPAEVEEIRKSCLLTSRTIAEVAKHIKPGITTKELDKIAFEFIKDHGAIPAFLNYPGQYSSFPATCCISVNDSIVHGIPDDRPLKDGDIIGVDTGTILNGWIGDSAYTFAIGNVSTDTLNLLRRTKKSLYLGIEQAKSGNRIGDIGYAIQSYTEGKYRYGIVRELSGHGLGKTLHEPPEVNNYGRRGNGLKLSEGLVIAIEPMINLGSKDIEMHEDGWTITTRDGLASAHFEHTICVKKGQADILTDHTIIEEAEAQNEYLTPVGIAD